MYIHIGCKHGFNSRNPNLCHLCKQKKRSEGEVERGGTDTEKGATGITKFIRTLHFNEPSEMQLVFVNRITHHKMIVVYERNAIPDESLFIRVSISTYRAIWTHGGPTAAFVHIVIALCLLIPRLLIESKLIENGNLPRGTN